jgi:hypothetical protein
VSDDLPPTDRVTAGGLHVFAKGDKRRGGGGHRNLVMDVSNPAESLRVSSAREWSRRTWVNSRFHR